MDRNESLEETASSIVKVFSANANADISESPDKEYSIRGGRVQVPRLTLETGVNDLIATLNDASQPEPAPFNQGDRALTLQAGVLGMLDTLQFFDDKTYALPLKAEDVEVEVKASGLNFVDVMVSMGQIQEPALGAECSGVVTRVGPGVTKFKQGDEVMTWLAGSFSTFIRNPQSMIQPIPEGMSFETAASLPVVYATAYQALIDAARVEEGETILIRSAAGGVDKPSPCLPSGRRPTYSSQSPLGPRRTCRCHDTGFRLIISLIAAIFHSYKASSE